MPCSANIKIYEQSWRAEPTRCNAGGEAFTSESSRALLNSRSSWTTVIPGASPAELEHTGTVSHCLMGARDPLWASTAAHPLLTADLDCFPHCNHASLPKSVSQAFSAQIHHCSSLQSPLDLSGVHWLPCWHVCDAPRWALLVLPCPSPALCAVLPSPSTPEAPRMSNPSATLI